MMLTRLTAQRHDYNLKLTKAELMSLYRLETFTEEPDDIKLWIAIGAAIRKEGDRLGEQQGSAGKGQSEDCG